MKIVFDPEFSITTPIISGFAGRFTGVPVVVIFVCPITKLGETKRGCPFASTG